MIAALLSAGVFVALPLTGRAAMGTFGPSIPAIARFSVWLVGGAAIWSAPLMLSLILGVYHPEVIGAAGWLTVAALLATRRVGRPGVPRLSRWDWTVVGGLVLAAGLAAAFATDPMSSGQDMGVYANDALYMVHHGRLDVPYPWPAGDPAPAAFQGYPGIFFTAPTLTVQFAHVFPAWLAQTYAATGYEGMIRLNIVLGVFSLLAIYGLSRRFVKPGIAAVGILFLAFNPAQVWVARQTLSEILTQLLVWCGLLLLTVYLARGRPKWGVWAGILLGTSALVRIDAFLLLPFLLLGHFMWVVARRISRRAAGPSWRYVYAGALPLFAVALAYYVLFSQPYLRLEGIQVLEIGGLTALAVAILATTRVRLVTGLASSMLADRRVVVGLLGVFVALVAYAFFVRPILPPFAHFDVPGAPYDGQRTYIEDALPNLGRYLTPAVVWAAVLGWSLLFCAAVQRAKAYLLPLLVITVGFASVYAWNQSIWPTHFWAVRRFVPEIIPAMVLFACIGMAWLLARLSAPGRRLAVALIIPLLVAWTAYIGTPMYLTAEGTGSLAALTALARSVPAKGPVVGLDGSDSASQYWMPLFLAFDRPIIPLDTTTEQGRAAATAVLAAATPDHPVTVLTAAYPFRMDAVVGIRTADAAWSTLAMASTTNPVSRVVSEADRSIVAIQAVGLNTIGVPFGGAPQLVAASSGFHPAQLVNGRPLRWTDGDATLAIPIKGDQSPTSISVSIADTGPAGGRLRITLNGVVLFDGVVGPGPWSGDYNLEGVVDLLQGDTANVEISSGTFTAEPIDAADRETTFGVQVDTVMLLGSS
jgi:Dolichyl-phosphate-mannose-protein mannosyltransferase